MNDSITEDKLGAKRRARRSTQETVDEIVQAAIREFGNAGFDGASFVTIGAACHPPMSGPNVAYHFKTKEELYVAAYRKAVSMWKGALAEQDAMSGITGINTMEDAIAALYSMVKELGGHASGNPIAEAAERLTVAEFLSPRPFVLSAVRESFEPMTKRVMTIMARLRPGVKMSDHAKIMKAIWALIVYPRLTAGVDRQHGSGGLIFDESWADVTMQLILLCVFTPKLPFTIDLPNAIPPGEPVLTVSRGNPIPLTQTPESE